MKLPSRRDSHAMQLQMTPMIDVVFQLLIFFVCTTSFQTIERLLPTALATSGGMAAIEEPDPELAELEDIVVKLTRSATGVAWTLNDAPQATFAALRERLERLARLRPDLPVVLDVAEEVALGDVIDVYDTCRVVGLDRIQFAARAP